MKMTKINLVFAAVFGAILLAGEIAKSQTGYPQPRENYVNDFAAILTPQDASEIRSLFKKTEENIGVEVTVVTIRSIRDYNTGDASIESFATNLFNTWGVGDKEKNNGVMILVALQDRKMRIELGAGYGREYDAVMKQIVDRDMIPYFKKNDYSKGIYQGAHAVVAQMAETPISTNPWPYVGFGAIAALAGSLGLWRYVRSHKPRCPNCQTYMAPLDDIAEDIYLESGQKLEELLQSVDYVVWKCASCGAHKLYKHAALFSRFKSCRRCGYRTLEVDTSITQHATGSAHGLQRISWFCRHCDYHDESTVVIPRLTRSYNTDPDGSSSSAGGSFGGGSSTGGGASGSW